MKRGRNPKDAIPFGLVDFHVALLGGGAAADLTVPANGTLTDDAAGLFPTKCNVALSGTYVSTGVYTCKYISDMQMMHLLSARAIVVSDGASPTAALVAVVTKLTPSTRAITVKVYTPAGTLTDLGTSDLLIIQATGRDTSA